MRNKHKSNNLQYLNVMLKLKQDITSRKTYNNRAKTNGKTIDCTDYECCNEELIFSMKDKKHQFSLGLSTVLECLMIAEKKGYVPSLPPEWWHNLR